MARPEISYPLDNQLVAHFGECVLFYVSDSDEFMTLNHYFGYFVKIGQKINKKTVIKARLVTDDENETRTFDSVDAFFAWEEKQEEGGNIEFAPDSAILVGLDFV